MIRLVSSAVCQSCPDTPPDGADPDKWAEKHVKTGGHSTITTTVPA